MPGADKIHKSLIEHNIDDSIINQIMEGYDRESTMVQGQQRADFIAEIIERMDKTIDVETRREIIEWCACCRGGIREKNIKKFAMENKDKTLAEKLQGLNNVQNMGNPKLNSDGTISCGIYWKINNEYKCPCPNFIKVKLEKPVSLTHCYCCAGHFKHHYQNALGVKLRVREVASSPLESLGKLPCHFVLEIVD